jgi:hypothetical protein
LDKLVWLIALLLYGHSIDVGYNAGRWKKGVESSAVMNSDVSGVAAFVMGT